MVGAVVVGLVLFASGCAANNDPASWEEASDDGTLKENFIRSCRTANDGGGLTLEQAASYCVCAFAELKQRYADDFGGFRDAESRLRSNPEDIDPAVRERFTRCLPQ